CFSSVIPMGTTAREEMSRFWEKNTKSNRPLSPHVTIYKWSLPMAMSITHRGTGVALSLGGCLGGGPPLGTRGGLIPPAGREGNTRGTRPSPCPPPIPGNAAGVSPQAWDLGKGLRLPQVTQSGVVVLALTLLSSAGLAAL
ncbi:C560 dehydrogenase, partial [Formicarius rufipectus]|nr:C560 dehydrogenase [Formicarius rufipectus]